MRAVLARSAALRCFPASLSAQHVRLAAFAQPAARQQCRSSSGGGGNGVAPPDVRELARLAHISVTDQEVADWGPKIEGIVEWFGQLQGVDVEGVPPALRADVEAAPALRPDVVTRHVAGSDLLQQAADREGPFVRVPKIATAADD